MRLLIINLSSQENSGVGSEVSERTQRLDTRPRQNDARYLSDVEADMLTSKQL